MKEDVRNLLKKRIEICHNIVLTGAPGTGKTFLARQIAAQMVLGKDDVDIDNLTPDEEAVIKERIAFVQFHPSYDYTDFVEGLRPVPQTDGSKEILFERRDGIFKEFCRRAERKGPSDVTCSDKDCRGTEKCTIEEAFYYLWNEIKEKRIFKLPQFQKGQSTQEMFVKDDAPNTVYFLRKDGSFNSDTSCTLKKVKTAYYDKNIQSLNKLKSLGSPDRKMFGSQSNQSNTWAVLNYLLSLIDKDFLKDNINPQYVFIIDEINRGELSKIFGELFFSIDPGYRGKKEMRVQTQYQNLIIDDTDPFKDGFYVPNNVYVIGTMNDIDRSIESMDFAIRRRFAWVEVKANENTKMLSKLGNREAKAKQVMITLNNAIWDDDAKKGIEGLSSAYHIGASYFLKLDKFKDSENPFKDLWDLHLEGLLREYLRGLDDAEEKKETLKKAYNEAAGING